MTRRHNATLMRKQFSGWLFLLLALCLVGSILDVDRGLAQEGKSFLWKVQSKTSTLYLLGSIHFLKQENYPLNPVIEKAFAQSSYLVVEADVSDPGKLKIETLLPKALYPDNDTLQNHVSAQTYELVQKETGKLGLPLELVARQKPWFLALTLEALELARLGFDPAHGIDSYFLSKAQGSKKILELESIDQQISLLSGLPDKDQELFLVYTLKDLNVLDEETASLVKAWSTGNANQLEAIMTKAIKEDRRLEPIFKRLLEDRNKGMVSTIEGYLKTKESYLVVVGAGHLVGDRGIVRLLKEKGYTVEQF